MKTRNRLFMVLALAWTLTGCGSSGGDDDPNAVPEWCLVQYSTDTQEWESGVRLESTTQMYVPAEEVEWLYQQVQNCMGVTAPGPTVSYESFIEDINDNYLIVGAMGQWRHPGSVFINTDDPLMRRNCKTDAANLSHESVHHLLYMSTGDPLSGHNSTLFGTPENGGCVPSF